MSIMIDDQIYFSDWLMNQLSERGWSQSELARRAGLSRQAISNYMVAKIIPNEHALMKIAGALHLPLNSVFRAAGLLPGAPPISEDMEEAIHILQQMDADDVRESVAILRAKLEHKQQNKGSQHRSQPYKQSRGTPAHHLLNEKK